MISPQAQTGLKSAKEYFRAHLTVGDYCAVRNAEYLSQKNAITGEWFGRGAERLNLRGTVAEAAFVALCEGNDPATGKRLTARRNNVRRKEGKTVANKRIFYDWVFSPPKSVSIVALMHDPRIVAAHARAVTAALQELETFAETRVRRGQTRGSRVTGNLVVARFRHDASRELDPQLHTHCIAFNATFDPIEDRWKALETHGMLKAQRFANGVYEHELCRELRAFGYRIRPTSRAFEIDGVSQSVLDRFSKRHQQIDRETAARIAREGQRGRWKDIREQVAHDRRRRKIKESTADRLRASWQAQLGSGERAALRALTKNESEGIGLAADIKDLLVWGEQHVFARRSVVAEHELLAAALVRGRGQEFSLRELRTELKGMASVFALDRGEITSRELFRLETELVDLARKTVRSERRLLLGFKSDPRLTEEQRRAVTKILESFSFITLFRGRAGAGKSFTVREVKRGLEEARYAVKVLAPQRQQVLDLTQDGLPAETLAQFLGNPVLPERSAILLDEAGQVGVRDLHRLVMVARKSGARVILSGDSRQHGAVAASDALVLLEKTAGLPVAKLRNIRRQDPKLAATTVEKRAIATYRAAVRMASDGRVVQAFDQLASLGWIHEQGASEGRARVADEYLAALARGERTLIVAQTWNEVDAVTEAVREARRHARQLGPGAEIVSHRAVDLTEAEKQEAGSYGPEAKVFFHKRYGRHLRGEVCAVVRATADGLFLSKSGREYFVGFGYADRWTVIRDRILEVAPGDRLQLKWNGPSLDGRPLANGELVTVKQIFPDGRIAIDSDRHGPTLLGPGQRLFNLGYAVTSYASQGKTVDTVLFSDGGSRAATNQKQFYVTISRARRRTLIFTPDMAALRLAIAADGHRRLAIEGTRGGELIARSYSPSLAKWHRLDPTEHMRRPNQKHAAGVHR